MQGVQNNPIIIASDGQEQEQLEKSVKQAMQCQKFNVALMGSDLNLRLQVSCYCQNIVQNKKQYKLIKNIRKYFKKEVNIDLHKDHFFPKFMPDYSKQQTCPDPTTMILFGVDFLTTSLIKAKFTNSHNNSPQIRWINDSNCKLVFKTSQDANIALQNSIINKKELNTKIQIDTDKVSREWFKVRSYFELVYFQRILEIRFATTEQYNLIKQDNIGSNYQKYKKTKQKFIQQELLQNQKAIRIYQALQQRKCGSRKSQVSRSSRNTINNSSRYKGSQTNSERQHWNNLRQRQRTRYKRNNEKSEKSEKQFQYKNNSYKYYKNKKSRNNQSTRSRMQNQLKKKRLDAQLFGQDQSQINLSVIIDQAEISHISNTSLNMDNEQQQINENQISLSINVQNDKIGMENIQQQNCDINLIPTLDTQQQHHHQQPIIQIKQKKIQRSKKIKLKCPNDIYDY